MFVTRLISGVILLAIAIVTMSLGNIVLALTLFIISLIAYRELILAFRKKASGAPIEPGVFAAPDNTGDKIRFNALEIVGFLGIAVYYAAIYGVSLYRWNSVLLLGCIMAVFLAEMFVYVVQFPKFQDSSVMAAFFSFLYAPVMLSFVFMTREQLHGIYLVWLILISSWGCDTCAYVVGMLIGRKKIFPVLSPKKSLEGCIGGAAGAALLGGLYAYFFVEPVFPDRTVVWAVAFICGVGAIMSMVGDLAASAIKRNHNIKDYGRLIPGHGGIMDRFDSMIVTAPMIYFLAVLLLQA